MLPRSAAKCCRSDIASFEYCKKTHSFNMYRCHAGLTECTAPIMDHNTIIGYIMFGQISDRTDKTAFRRELMSRYPGKEMADMINKIKFKKSKQLLAASKILETCTSYILAKEMVT
ncbi:MAG: PocR ligand-binding domain-containing protein, partial [Clostridia bacterium]|nr:PocR ligand-binding domain-containing protein [Clostridia bacterium]